MSLINQMLRDLESRNKDNNVPSALQNTIRLEPSPASKMRPVLWGLLSIIATGGTYWAYQYSRTLTKVPPIVVAEPIKKASLPIPPHDNVPTAPNAVAVATPKIEQKAQEKTAPQPAHPIPIAQPSPKIQPATPAQPVQKPSAAPAAVEIAAEEPPIKKEPVLPKPAPTQQTTAKQQADLLYSQAENSFDDYSALNKLERALKLDPRHLKARLLLAKTLHNQGQINKTAAFLDQSLALFPGNLQFINTRAQLFLHQKNPESALKTLQSVDLTDSSNETYLSLLAAAYQQLQSFSNAAKVYQKLTAIDPEKAENWLGLGLSQEKLGNAKFARDAYQQALNKNTLKDSVAGYIKQRLVELR